MRVERVGTSTVVSLSDVVLITGGSGPNFTVASADGKIRPQDGLPLLLRMDRSSPTNPTLSVDGSPRAQWRDANGGPLPDGALQRDSLQRVVYDASRGIWLGTQLGGPGTAGVTPNFTGTLVQRSAYDGQPQGKIYLAIADTPAGPEWTLYTKQSDSFGDWSAGLPIKASAAQTTADAQEAADKAAVEAQAAAAKAQAAASAAQDAGQRASVATASANTAVAQASLASIAASTSTQNAAFTSQRAEVAVAQAGAAISAKAAAEAARDLALPAASQATAAAASTAGDAAQTSNDRAVSGSAVSITQAARDATIAAAADAQSFAAMLSTAVFDWSYDSAPDPTNDWSS